MRIDQILLTTDFSDHARRAYPCAAHLTAVSRARLHLVHFAGAFPSLIPSPSRETLFDALEAALAEEISSHSAFQGVEADGS